MTTSESTKTATRSLTADVRRAARYYLGNRRALMILALVAIAGGAALNWGWLVAIGVAPVLLAVLPCLVMCGLGLCMAKMVGGSCTTPQPDKADLSQSSGPVQTAPTTANPLARISSCCGVGADVNRPTDERKT